MDHVHVVGQLADWHSKCITRDGFHYTHGMFWAMPGGVNRVEGRTLRRMFLQELTPEGRKQARAGPSDEFVRGQLKHYGVEFEESEISANGTTLMKKVLKAGKCDTVPDHIAKLHEQMYAEWLDLLEIPALLNSPKWLVDKYFVSNGQPDRTKTTTVVTVPLVEHNLYRVHGLCKAVGEVEGLHYSTTERPAMEKTVYIGWDSVAVDKLAKDHNERIRKALKEAEVVRERERLRLHTAYLDNLGKKKPTTYSPVGSYMIKCKEIEEWPDQSHDLTVDIRKSEQDGIFEAFFDLGIIVGIMMISTDETALKRYCKQLDSGGKSRRWAGMTRYTFEGESDSGDEENNEAESNTALDGTKAAEEGSDDTENEPKSTTGAKRKQKKSSKNSGRPAKKPKGEALPPHTYHLRFKSEETGTGELQYIAEKGTLTFDDETLATFGAKGDFPSLGPGTPFTGRKISDVSLEFEATWFEYSDNTIYGGGMSW